jgi:hypothetical protein
MPRHIPPAVASAPREEPSVERGGERRDRGQGEDAAGGGAKVAPSRPQPGKLNERDKGNERDGTVDKERVEPPQELPEIAVLPAIRGQAQDQENQGGPQPGAKDVRRGPRPPGARLIGIRGHGSMRG